MAIFLPQPSLIFYPKHPVTWSLLLTWALLLQHLHIHLSLLTQAASLVAVRQFIEHVNLLGLLAFRQGEAGC